MLNLQTESLVCLVMKSYLMASAISTGSPTRIGAARTDYSIFGLSLPSTIRKRSTVFLAPSLFIIFAR